MRGIIWLVLLFVVAVVAATTLGRNDGLVSIYFGAWRTDLSLNLFVILVLASCAVLMVAARSVNRLLSLPPATQLHMCHDYQPGGRDVQFVTTVADERQRNVHVRDGIGEEAFVMMRRARDATLDLPALMLPAVQVNMRAGQLPEPESNGTRYIKIPIDAV